MMMLIVTFILFILSPTVVISQTSRFEPLRMNCGGTRFIDPVTNYTWRTDTYYLNGNDVSQCSNQQVTISNTTTSMRALYCSNRDSRTNIKYNIPVLSTTSAYIVRLHFAELVRLLLLTVNITCLECVWYPYHVYFFFCFYL
jgi:hypothetical protein